MYDQHGYEVTTEDGIETIIDTAIPSDFKRLKKDGETILFDGKRVEDVYDVETETHLDPSGWYEETAKFVK